MTVPVGFSPAGLLVSPVATLLLTWLVRFQTPTIWDARSCAATTTGEASINASVTAPTSLDVMGSPLAVGLVSASNATTTPPDAAQWRPPPVGSVAYICYVNAQYVQAFPLPRETT